MRRGRQLPTTRTVGVGMARYVSSCTLKRELTRAEVLLILAHIAADYLAPVLCRVRLHLWEDGRCVECGKPC